MKRDIHDKMDNLFNELARLEMNQLAGTHLTPETIFLFQERLVKKLLKECELALHPMLRDMISRGQAMELIKKHFGVEE